MWHLGYAERCVGRATLQNLNSRMGKLRQWFRVWFDRQIEKSMQRQANKLFERGKKWDNTETK